jgi:hypothetical protein
MLLSVAATAEEPARDALLSLAGHLPSPLTLFNEPDDTPVGAVLPTLGFARYDRQHELLLEPLSA